jgi:hypothetical protein
MAMGSGWQPVSARISRMKVSVAARLALKPKSVRSPWTR